MKLVFRADSLEQANEIKATLETAGIPTMISGENFSALRIPFFPNNLGVFIYLDKQYNDAVQLLSDPDYIPEHSVDVEEFYELLDSEDFRHSLNKGYLTVFAWLVALILVLIFILNLILY